MKIRIWGQALAGLALVALAMGATGALAGPTVDVTVRDGVVSTSQSTIAMNSGDDGITFVIRTEGYAFAPGGVSIGSANSGYRCAPANDANTSYRCVKRGHASGSNYQVQINVVSRRQTRTAPPDPPNGIWVQDN
jgi:hypothetical protein